MQRHFAKSYRKEAPRKLITALEQTRSTDATQVLLELEAWLRTKNESAADSLLEAFEDLLTQHRGCRPCWQDADVDQPDREHVLLDAAQ